jgi:hypothetical protein
VLFQPVARNFELGLFETVGREDRDLFSFEMHDGFPCLRPSLLKNGAAGERFRVQ